MTNILEDVHAIEPTELSKKLTFEGITKSYPVYKVKIDRLYYNDQNDRVVTFISKYKQEKNITNLSQNDIEEYNKIIEQFIIESNPQAYNKTRNNIELFEQTEPAVILNDGRVIDGNRRFTCLRELSKKDDKFKYIETVILDKEMGDHKKAIKLLELQLQHGREERVSYNAIDKLVGLYNDVLKTKLLTEEEYIKSTNEKRNEVKKNLTTAQYMVEFLEFINCEEQYHIARDLSINGPLNEIDTILKKLKTTEEKENMKHIIFTYMAMNPGQDITRYIRRFSDILKSEYHKEFLEENLSITEKFLDKVDEIGEVNTAVINDEIRTDNELMDSLEKIYEKYLERAKIEKSFNAPKQQVNKAVEALRNIDLKLLKKSELAVQKEFNDAFVELKSTIEEIESEVEQHESLS